MAYDVRETNAPFWLPSHVQDEMAGGATVEEIEVVTEVAAKKERGRNLLVLAGLGTAAYFIFRR
jgi:hypothetical protein